MLPIIVQNAAAILAAINLLLGSVAVVVIVFKLLRHGATINEIATLVRAMRSTGDQETPP